MKLRRLGQATLGLTGAYLAALAVSRRWHQHWGATVHEITQPLPGDHLIPSAKLDSTHAITIAAPAECIWPWLAQMGYEDRAGTYSYDLFERSIGRNLDRLDPAIPPLTAGATMPFAPGMPMTVAVADPPNALVLWQVTSAGTAIDPAGPWGDDHVAWTWAFVLEPVDAATTRLLVRMRVGYQPAAKWAPYMWLLVEPAHFVMGRRQLLGIQRRAEAKLGDGPESGRGREDTPAPSSLEVAGPISPPRQPGRLRRRGARTLGRSVGPRLAAAAAARGSRADSPTGFGNVPTPGVGRRRGRHGPVGQVGDPLGQEPAGQGLQFSPSFLDQASAQGDQNVGAGEGGRARGHHKQVRWTRPGTL